MNVRIKNKRRMTGRVIAFALCLILTGSMAAIPAFADDTFVVIGGTQAINSGIYSGYNVVGSNFSGNALTQTAGVVIGSDNLTGSIQANNNSQQTVVVNNNSETITVVSDGITTNTVTVSNPVNNSMTGTTTGTVLSNGTAQVVATSEAGSTVVASSVSGLRAEIFEMTNAFRAENGLNTLSYNDDLQAAANTRAQESAVQFNHVRPDGSEAHTVVTVDYHVTGENLIQAENSIVSADILMETWKNSGTHRMNLLHPSYTSMAVGVYQENGMTFVSQIFLG